METVKLTTEKAVIWITTIVGFIADLIALIGLISIYRIPNVETGELPKISKVNIGNFIVEWQDITIVVLVYIFIAIIISLSLRLKENENPLLAADEIFFPYFLFQQIWFLLFLLWFMIFVIPFDYFSYIIGIWFFNAIYVVTALKKEWAKQKVVDIRKMLVLPDFVVLPKIDEFIHR